MGTEMILVARVSSTRRRTFRIRWQQAPPPPYAHSVTRWCPLRCVYIPRSMHDSSCCAHRFLQAEVAEVVGHTSSKGDVLRELLAPLSRAIPLLRPHPTLLRPT